MHILIKNNRHFILLALTADLNLFGIRLTFLAKLATVLKEKSCVNRDASLWRSKIRRLSLFHAPSPHMVTRTGDREIGVVSGRVGMYVS